ncbi:PadR family transcriptional regulator [Nocardia terpenica]|uniref:PadR family transcriptional regulator n=1 Tax=Nocardia terpenica TaxID=455432 RepID=UPI001895AEED|nr:PadR family transcriptional regulator [Nocardia terpenica]MBF6059900.1 PadR family transcriptional regulator [Nocardia terpenica]MBF6102559.1 PadR family transcriptional regulator [Nocardia terpenica]MBF6111250.1 PadR family transcriptional regulator [Nocardia terpenica]MBF6117381.1 PadR family transcriptional regulator [Nocardia terpenica]MBF6150778.1 PadR family transcriptional regulator [Nocardia terpenica]
MAVGKQSSLTIAVLALLAEGPLHVYGMQRLIKERSMDRVVNVRNRSGLYAAIERLVRDGLIVEWGTERDARHPERTLYELTEAGRETLHAWLRETVTEPARGFPPFPAAVSFLHLLDSGETARCLRIRAEAVEGEIATATALLTHSTASGVARLHLLESEYLLATLTAELAWIRGVIDDIERNDLSWGHYDGQTDHHD